MSDQLTAPRVYDQPPYVDGEHVPCHLCGKGVFVKRDGTYRERIAPAVSGEVHDCRSPAGASR